MERPERPLGVTILAILLLIEAILALLSGLFLMAVGTVMLPIPLLGLAIVGFSTFGMIFGVIGLFLVYGLWTGRSWGWWLTLIIAVLIAALSLIGWNLIVLIMAIIVIIYLTRPHVRAYFGV